MFECMLDQSVSEHRPERCPNGHVYVDGAGSRVKIGWEPCLCTTGHTGHRWLLCETCGHLLEIPPCVRVESRHLGGAGHSATELATPPARRQLIAGSWGRSGRPWRGEHPGSTTSGTVGRGRSPPADSSAPSRLPITEVGWVQIYVGTGRPELVLHHTELNTRQSMPTSVCRPVACNCMATVTHTYLVEASISMGPRWTSRTSGSHSTRTTVDRPISCQRRQTEGEVGPVRGCSDSVEAPKSASARRGSRGKAAQQPADRDQVQAIREWARSAGYQVSARGRIPRTIHEAFDAAH